MEVFSRCCCVFVHHAARRRVMRAGLPKANDVTGMRSVSSGTGMSGMSESRQLSVVKTRHMAVLVTGTFLFYSTVSTIVFQVDGGWGDVFRAFLHAVFLMQAKAHERARAWFHVSDGGCDAWGSILGWGRRWLRDESSLLCR